VVHKFELLRLQNRLGVLHELSHMERSRGADTLEHLRNRRRGCYRVADGAVHCFVALCSALFLHCALNFLNLLCRWRTCSATSPARC